MSLALVFLLGLVVDGFESVFVRYDVQQVAVNSWKPTDTIIGKQ
jgi:hypothetical protein